MQHEMHIYVIELQVQEKQIHEAEWLLNHFTKFEWVCLPVHQVIVHGFDRVAPNVNEICRQPLIALSANILE